jgi:hypothetical protein
MSANDSGEMSMFECFEVCYPDDYYLIESSIHYRQYSLDDSLESSNESIDERMYPSLSGYLL